MFMVLLSNRLCIDCIVLPVCADEPNVDHAIRVIDPHHKAILVTRDIEHSATVVQDARTADCSLHVRWRRPIGSPNLPEPGHQRLAPSAYAGLRPMNALSVLSAMILTE